MMRGSYTEIGKNQIKHCNKCGREICFVKNRFDKWFPVDVVYPQRRPAYKHSAGAHKNMIPWHVCLPQRDFEGERLAQQAARLSQRLAHTALLAFRKDPDADQSRLLAVMEHSDARLKRRLTALPEASRAHMR